LGPQLRGGRPQAGGLQQDAWRYLRTLFMQGARVILLRPANWAKHSFGLWLTAAADALRTLWESEENQKYLRETGFGASYLYPAQVALEAALKVRGRTVSEPPTASQ